MLNRRELLSTAAVTVAASALPLAALTPAFAADAPASDPKLAALFDAFFQEGLRRSPEGATQLGLDKGANADLRGKLRDESAAGIAASKAQNADQLARLKAFDASKLSPADKLNYDTVLYTRESAVAVGKFEFGGSGFGPGPYVVSQQTGVYQSFPDFMDTKHPVANASDADAYMARLSGFAQQLDDNTERMQHDAGIGIVPPDYILDLTIAQLERAQKPADQALLVTSIARRAKEKGLGDSYAANAELIYNEQIVPALARQTAQAKKMRAHAVHDAGLWQFKDGPAFYEVALQATTTTKRTPDEVHKFGLDQAAMISSRIDALLKKEGLTKGTVGERMAALAKDPKYLYPNTDAGKLDAIGYCNKRLGEIRPKLPGVFKRVPTYAFEVRRVPVETELGAASAFSQQPSLDGARPGIVYFNLHDSAEWPRFSLSTTVFHEGLPGHQLESSLALMNGNLPLIRKTIGFSGYAEGWALYAEQLADEIGMYDEDPVGRIGYLKMQMFRAGRCVVDTGMHHMKWSKEKCIAYFVALDGDPEGFATREVERYTVQPGQACSYKLGHSVFVEGREKAKKALGARFDIKDFHEAGLSCGRVPLDILEAVLDDYVKKAMG
jgi:uncharacterized protein (DUF885 family)